MKRSNNSIAAIKAILALFLASLYPIAHGCELTSAWEAWEPYQYESNNVVTGLDNDLVSAIARQAGCTVKFVGRPWARALHELKEGLIQVAPGASINEERQQFSHFSQPYRDEIMALFVRKDESKKYDLKKITDILNYEFNLGGTRDYYYGKDFEKAMESKAFSARVALTPNADQLFKKLVAKRVDGVLEDKFVGIYQLKKSGLLEQVEIHPLVVNEGKIYLMYSKKSVTPEVVAKWNDAIVTIKSNGVYDKIVSNYSK